MRLDRSSRWRLPIFAAAAVLAIVMGGSAVLAESGSTPSTAPSPASTTSPAATPTNPFDAAVQQLVEQGTIDQAQANVLHEQIGHGSIDPRELVDNGTLTETQMQAVDDRLAAVKEAQLGAAPVDAEDGAKAVQKLAQAAGASPSAATDQLKAAQKLAQAAGASPSAATDQLKAAQKLAHAGEGDASK